MLFTNLDLLIDEHDTTHNEPTTAIAPTTTMTEATTTVEEEIDYEATKVEKRIQEHREYRRKLAEDPSFVPYLGLFWSHDDRYREDSLTDNNNHHHFTTHPPSSSDAHQQRSEQQPYFSSQHQHSRASYDKSADPLMYKKWDHSGYEELLRLDEQNERRKRELLEAGVTEEELSKRRHYSQRGGRGNRGGRGGYHHHGQRYNNFNNNYHYRNKFNRQHEKKEEWPELGSSGTPAATEKSNAWANVTPDVLQEHDKPPQQELVNVQMDQSIPVATNTPQGKTINLTLSELVDDSAPTINAWGSVDREKEILDVDNKKEAGESDGWEASSSSSKVDGWNAPSSGKADGWNNTTSTASENNNGWGTPNAKTDGWANKSDWNNVTQDIIVDTTETEAAAVKPSSDTNKKAQWTDSKSVDWNTSSSAPKQDTKTTSGWKSEPLTETKSTPAPVQDRDDLRKQSASTQGWNSTTTTDNNSGWGTPAVPIETFTTTTTNVTAPPQHQLTTDHWKLKSTTNDWNTSKKVPDQFMDAESSSSSFEQNKTNKHISIEEKAASSWTLLSENAEPEKPFMSDNRYRRNLDHGYRNNNNNRYDNNNASRKYQNYNAEGNWKQQNYHNKVQLQQQVQQEKEKEQEQEWDLSAESQGWADTTSTPATNADGGWGSTSAAVANATAETKDVNGWGESKSTAVADSWNNKTAEKIATDSVEKPTAANTTTITEKASTATSNESWTTPATNSTVKAAAWGAEASEDSETQKHSGWSSTNNRQQQQQNGWSNNSSSSNWNADKRANNQQQARSNKDQPRKGRGYLSQKMENTSITSSPPPQTFQPQHQEEEEEQVYIGGDEDSDVEIILEAEEEPDWVKNEEILGMTAPRVEKEEQEYDYATPTPITATLSSSTSQGSPRYNNNNGYRRNYDSSSPQPEMHPQQHSNYRGKNYNPNYRGGNKPRRNYDDNWRQRDENENMEQQPRYYQPARGQMPPPTMYYPQPITAGHQGQFYMIPANGIPPPPPGQNGTTPMYAMPYHPSMGSSSSPNRNGSASPHSNHSNSDHSPAYIHQQQQPKLYAPPPLPPGYEANGMVYYGMDPNTAAAAIYAAPQPLPGQPIYYYAAPAHTTNAAHTAAPIPVPPPPMFFTNTHHPVNNNSQSDEEEEEEDGWGSTPNDIVEEEWSTRGDKDNNNNEK